MSGGGGGHIIINSVRKALSDPLVHGQLPQPMAVVVDAVLEKENDDWDQHDKQVIAECVEWCLLNCH